MEKKMYVRPCYKLLKMDVSFKVLSPIDVNVNETEKDNNHGDGFGSNKEEEHLIW